VNTTATCFIEAVYVDFCSCACFAFCGKSEVLFHQKTATEGLWIQPYALCGHGDKHELSRGKGLIKSTRFVSKTADRISIWPACGIEGVLVYLFKLLREVNFDPRRRNFTLAPLGLQIE
jgi:hypothetical protein